MRLRNVELLRCSLVLSISLLYLLSIGYIAFNEKSGDVYTAYRDYCARVGDYIRSTTDFYAALENAGFKRKRTKSVRLIYGLRLKSEFLEN